jgi:hypothetical protein
VPFSRTGEEEHGQLDAEEAERALGHHVEHLRQRRPVGDRVLDRRDVVEGPLPLAELGVRPQRL